MRPAPKFISVGLFMCLGFLIAATASDVLANRGSHSVSLVPSSGKPPVIGVSFPTTGFYYSGDVWNKGFPGASGSEAGCGTRTGATAGDICGTTTGETGSVVKVEVSAKKGSGGSARYWDGVGFNSSVEVFSTADGTANWNLNFGFERFQAGIYAVHVRAIDDAGIPEAESLRMFSASPDYTIIPVISSLGLIGKGSHPASMNIAAMVDLKVFDKSEFRIRNDGEVEPLSYGNIWEGVSDVVQLVSSTNQLLNVNGFNPPLASLNCQDINRDDDHGRDCGEKIQYGNDDAYIYEIMVPSSTNANRAAFGISGSYLVIGKGIICMNGVGTESSDGGTDRECIRNGGVPTPVYIGTNTDSVQSGRLSSEKHLKVTVDGNGRIHSMRSRQIEGTPLVISVPAYVGLADTMELVPIIYESVDEDWQSTMNIAPPEGFVADIPTVELLVHTGETVVAQIAITGVVSSQSFIAITHSITYKGKTTTVQMNLKMDNRQISKSGKVSNR